MSCYNIQNIIIIAKYYNNQNKEEETDKQILLEYLGKQVS